MSLSARNAEPANPDEPTEEATMLKLYRSYANRSSVIGLGSGRTVLQFVKAIHRFHSQEFNKHEIPKERKEEAQSNENPGENQKSKETSNALLKSREKTKERASPPTFLSASRQTANALSAHGLHESRLLSAEPSSFKAVDVYFDSADFYTPSGALLKGGGGALTMERLIMAMAGEAVVMVQRSKRVESFEGLRVAVEAIPAAQSLLLDKAARHRLNPVLRAVDFWQTSPKEAPKKPAGTAVQHICSSNGRLSSSPAKAISPPFTTELGNLIVDVDFSEEFLRDCRAIPGVLDHGFWEANEKIRIVEL